ncbi:DUF1819 family protein [Candidatus Saccharibacteria bacterium]|nr:DUF1819 family protein [Candidatus Saccharibacteria bacterium]
MKQPQNISQEYTASLTAEPLLFSETKLLASFLQQGEDLGSLKERNLNENLIMHKRTGSLKRVNSPLFRRLSAMSENILDTFTTSDDTDAKIILLYIICNTDRLVRDFIINIYGDKVLIQSDKIVRADIEQYFESVYSESDKLLNCSYNTKAKLKQTLMKILADAGLVTKQSNDFLITTPIISERIRSTILADGGDYYIKALGGTC